MIIYDKLESNLNSKLVFENLRSRLEKKHFKQWYYELVTVEMHHDISLISKSFPTPNLKKEIILNEIAESCKELKTRSTSSSICKKKKQFNQDLVDNDLIINVLSPLAIGIPMFGQSTQTEGECLLIDQKKFLEIEITRFDSNSSLIKSILNNLPRSLKTAVHDTNWLEYKFKNGMMIFFGSPDKSDIGKYQIRIHDMKSFVVKEFYVEVVEELDQHSKIITPLMHHNLKIMHSRLSQGHTSGILSLITNKKSRNNEKEREIKEEINENKEQTDQDPERMNEIIEIEFEKERSPRAANLNSDKGFNSSKVIICKGDDEAVDLESVH